MKTISKIILSVAALCAATDFSFAQTFSNTPNDTINITGMLEDLGTLTIQPLNISSDTITLKWKKVSESVPLLWDASVCDNANCYGSLVDSGMMTPLNPATLGLLLLHITPHVNYGTAVIRYAVWDIANPTLKDTLTFILTANATAGISEAENKNAVSIYPNPSQGIFNVTSKQDDIKTITVSDNLGRIILQESINAKSALVNLTNEAKGIYFLKIQTAKSTETVKLISE
jgi:hypothetical protein